MATLTFFDKTFTNPFTLSQFSTFLALADTFIPALTPDEISSIRSEIQPNLFSSTTDWDSEIAPFLSCAASDDPSFCLYLAYFFAVHVPAPQTARVAGFLDALGGGWRTYLFCSTTAPFSSLPRDHRERILKGWKMAALPVFRAVFERFRALTVALYLRTSSALFRALRYPPVDVRKHSEAQTATRGHPVFSFERWEDEEAVVEVDVVIVGSGAGGQVVAAKLAAKGVSVLVADKGQFFPQGELPLTELEAFEGLYENGGAIMTSDGSGGIITASTWGGGTTVNWSVSLQLQRKVRQEWAEKFGLGFVESEAFQECQDRVYDRMGVSTDNIRHNFVNSVLMDGARKLGYRSVLAPRNVGSETEHYCGYCNHGCNHGEKRGGTITWLADAQKAGARFVQNCVVSKVLIENGMARGISALVGGKTELTVKAKRVVLSAGAFYSPYILTNSGVKNPNIGANLKLHPALGVSGIFYNTEVKPWEGGIITAYATDFENQDGHGYGAKIMPTAFHPSLALSGLHWSSAKSWRADVLQFPQTCALIAIVRDRDSVGTVSFAPGSASPKVDYTFAPFDRASMLEALIGCAEIFVAAGADELGAHAQGWPRYKVDKDGAGTSDPRFKEWVKELRRIGVTKPYYSAHPQGTCRMGSDPRASVVDMRGEVWGVKGLFVADASVLPSPTGVNPMVPVMAMADWIGGGILEGLL